MKIIRPSLLMLFLVPPMSLSAVTPEEFLYKIEHYHEDRDASLLDDALDVYEKEKVPPRMDSLLFMFFLGMGLNEPERYGDFALRAKERRILRLMQVAEVIGEYDLDAYLADPRPGREYAGNLLALFYGSGDPAFLSALFLFIKENGGERGNREIYLGVRYALWELSRLARDQASIGEMIKGSPELDDSLRAYILETEPEVILGETEF